MRPLAALGIGLVLAFPTVAPAADPGNGSTLYHGHYKCTDCHTASPGPGSALSSGATVAGLRAAIDAVGPMSQRYTFTLANNANDLADIAAYLAQATGASAPFDIGQHGLTGSWYEAATSGQGIELELFPHLVAADTAYVQGAWFTYDATPAGGADRQRWYTFGGNAKTGTTSAAVTIYQNVGGNFAAPPTTTAVAVGTGTLSLADCANATFAYTFSDGSGRSGSIPLTRLTPNVTCVPGGTPPANADFAYSGNWYDAATSGQGFVVDVNPNAPVLFLTWYTYAPNASALGAPGQRWYTGQAPYTPGARTIALTLYETTGGQFDQPSNPAPSTVAVGTATVTFASCAAATISYTFTGGTSAGRSGSISLVRPGPVPPGCSS